MKKDQQEKLESIGVDVESTLERFMGNEELYLKFAKKAAEDPAVKELREALEGEDLNAAYRCAHTLKGVAANLGFSCLQSAAEEMVQLLRKPHKDRGRILMAFGKVEEAMEAVIRVTRAL